VVQSAQTVDLLLDVLHQVGLFSKLLLIDALHGVDFVVGGFELYLLHGENEGECALA
jgi:hypothetical protein